MELHEESVGSCRSSPAGCAEASCTSEPARRWSMVDLDCPLLEPLPREVRDYYEEQQGVRRAWDAEIDRKIAEVEWARKHPEEAARRNVERHFGGASLAMPAPAPEGWEPDTPDPGIVLPFPNLCERSPCLSVKDVIKHLTWDTRVAVASESVADLAGTPPEGGSASVCFNGGKWMAVDTQGRAFVVHIRGARIRLLIFAANNPSTVYYDRLIDPRTVDRDVIRVAAPCIAISPYGSGTAFTIAFLGSPVLAQNRLYVSQGWLPQNASPVTPYTQRLVQAPDGYLANPAVFHDNLNIAHLVVTYTIEQVDGPVSSIVWFCAPWTSPSSWLFRMTMLGPGRRSPPLLGFPSVAARWDDGQLAVVVACKFEARESENTGVYVNISGGNSTATLTWTGWDFLAGVDVNVDAVGVLWAADPSVWVNDCGRFYIGYQQVNPEDVNGLPIRYVRPVISSNPHPVQTPLSWTPVMLYPSKHTSKFVHVAGNENFMFSVWEARNYVSGGIGPELAPTWAGAVGVHSVGRSGGPDWGIVDPTSGWGLLDGVSDPDMLLFPTSYIVGDVCFVAWFYVDRSQIQNPVNELSDLRTWISHSNVYADLYFMRGEIACP